MILREILNDYRSIFTTDTKEVLHANESSLPRKETKSAKQSTHPGNAAARTSGSTGNQIIRNLEVHPDWRGWMGVRSTYRDGQSEEYLEIEGFSEGAGMYCYQSFGEFASEIHVSCLIKVLESNERQGITIRSDGIRKGRLFAGALKDGNWHAVKMHFTMVIKDEFQIIIHSPGTPDNHSKILIKDLHVSERAPIIKSIRSGYPAESELPMKENRLAKTTSDTILKLDKYNLGPVSRI